MGVISFFGEIIKQVVIKVVTILLTTIIVAAVLLFLLNKLLGVNIFALFN